MNIKEFSAKSIVNEEQCKKIQELAIELGFGGHGGNERACFIKSPFIILNNSCIVLMTNAQRSAEVFDNKECPLYLSENLIAKLEEALEAKKEAEKPKRMTVIEAKATLEVLLGHPVEIVGHGLPCF